jgi:hypothetical protein
MTETLTYGVAHKRRDGEWVYVPTLNGKPVDSVFCSDVTSAGSTAYAVAMTCKQQKEQHHNCTVVVELDKSPTNLMRG